MNTPTLVVPLPSQSPVTGIAPGIPKWTVWIGVPFSSARIHCDWDRSAPVQETGSKSVFCGYWTN